MEQPSQTKHVYELPGEQIHTLEDFYRIIGEAINGPGGYFGAGLDSFNDCLAGGFGTPDDGFILRWQHSDESRAALGYPETIRQLQLRLRRCHPANVGRVRQELARARRHEGPTTFDWLVEIIGDACVYGVKLELV